MRELVLVAKRVDGFPSDGLEGALADVFDVDVEDAPTAGLISQLLAAHGLTSLAAEVKRGRVLGDLTLQLEHGEDTETVVYGDGKGPAAMPEKPKHGDWDGKQHVGGKDN